MTGGCTLSTNTLELVEGFYHAEPDLGRWWERTNERLLELVPSGGFVMYGVLEMNQDLDIVSMSSDHFPREHSAEVTRLINATLDPTVPGSLASGAIGREVTLSAYPALFLSEDLDIAGLGDDDVMEYWEQYVYPAGIRESFLIQLGDLSHRTMIMLGLTEPLNWDEATRAHWEYVGSHLHAGLRLQRARDRSGGADPTDGASAILDGDGSVLEVFEETLKQDAATRESVREVAGLVDRARGTMRGRPHEALEIWQGLIEGEYSLVDHFDSDGRRLVLLRRNAPGAVRSARLSRRERQVVTEAGKGFPNKLIAYNLGLSPSTVSTLIKRAMTKLKLHSRAQLVELSTRLARGLDDAP
jgi:DNA-binding CsgD family transcriptional regulator